MRDEMSADSKGGDGGEEEKQQVSVQQASTSSSSSSSASIDDDAHDLKSTSTAASSSSSTVSPPAVNDEASMTASELAATTLPALPVLPFALLDPLSPVASPINSPRVDAAFDSPSTLATPTASLAELMAPFLTAYESQRRTLLASDASLKRLHANCTTDLKAAVKSAEKRSLARMNLSECQAQHTKLVERLSYGSAEQVKLQTEIRDKQERIDAVKGELLHQGQVLEGETKVHLATVQVELDKKHASLAQVQEQMSTTRASLSTCRQSNIDMFVSLQALQASVTGLSKQVATIVSQIHTQQRWLKSQQQRQDNLDLEIKSLQKRLLQKQEKSKEKAEMCEKLKKEESDLGSSVAHHAQQCSRMKLEDEQAAQQEKEERLKLQAMSQDYQRQQEEMAHLLKIYQHDKRNLQALKRSCHQQKLTLEYLRSCHLDSLREIEAGEAEKSELQAELAQLTSRYERSSQSAKLAKEASLMQAKQSALLQTQLEHGQDVCKTMQHTIKLKENIITTLESEIHSFHNALAKHDKTRLKIQNEMAQYESMRSKLVDKVTAYDQKLQEQLKLIEQSTASSQYLKCKHDNQAVLLQSMLQDRDVLRGQLVEMHSALKYERQMVLTKVMSVQDVRKRIVQCDHLLGNIQRERLGMLDMIASITQQHDDYTRQLQTLQGKAAENDASSKTLTCLCADASNEAKVQSTQYHSIQSESRVLTQQLITRESELQTCYNELRLIQARVQQSSCTLQKLDAMRSEKEAYVTQLQQMLDTVLLDVKGVQELKVTLSELKDRLQASQAKERALKDECSTILNVHRWRSLRDGQGEMFGVVQQAHRLQKSIIALQSQIELKLVEIKKQSELQTQLQRLSIQSEAHLQTSSSSASSTALVLSSSGNPIDQELELQCQEKRQACKAVQSQLEATMRAKHHVQHEIELLKKEKAAISAQYFAQRAQQEREAGSKGGSEASSAHSSLASTFRNKKQQKQRATIREMRPGERDEEEEEQEAAEEAERKRRAAEEDDVLSRPSFGQHERYDENGERLDTAAPASSATFASSSSSSSSSSGAEIAIVHEFEEKEQLFLRR